MLPLLALTSAALFFILLRMGVLDELPTLLGRPRTAPRRRVRRMLKDEQEVEEAKRLEVFKDFLEGDGEEEQ
ncbi:MAG TPA: hypothetical protein VI410_02925 [Anaerolineales bacterium]|nr:hypothetical protein [Anaerolineales bacterium]